MVRSDESHQQLTTESTFGAHSSLASMNNTTLNNPVQSPIEPPFTTHFIAQNVPPYHNMHSSSLNHMNDTLSRNKNNRDNLSSTSSLDWSSDVDIILERIRCNSIILSDYHKQNYFYLHSRLKYFRIPVIIISAFASVFNIGLQPFIDQGWISIICCLMSLITGLIGSIELFLQIQKRMESDLTYSRDYYLLAIDIYKVLSLDPDNRNGEGGTFLDDKFNIYRKMVENSNILDKKIMDQLTPIDTRLTRYSEGVVKSNANQAGGNDAINHTNSTDYHDEHHNTKNTKHDKVVDVQQNINSFHSYFWKPNPNEKSSKNQEIHETSSVDTEERFQIYCDLVQKSDYIEEGVLEKITPILVSHRKNQEYELSMEDRMKLFCYFLDNADKLTTTPDLIEKMKPILMSDFFQSSEPDRKVQSNTTEDKFKLYKAIMEHRNVLDESAINKIKHVLMCDIKTNSINKKDHTYSWMKNIGSMIQHTPKTSTSNLHGIRNWLSKDINGTNASPIHNLYDLELVRSATRDVSHQQLTTESTFGADSSLVDPSLRPVHSELGVPINSVQHIQPHWSANIPPVNLRNNMRYPPEQSSSLHSNSSLNNIQGRSGQTMFGRISNNIPENNVGVCRNIRSSQLYSINIPNKPNDEISFIEGTLK